MAEQRLVYILEGDATSLKKAYAEAQEAEKRFTEALTKKSANLALLTQAEQELERIKNAASEARRNLDFFRRSAEIAAPAGIKQFAKDIDQASRQLEKLTQQTIQQKARVDALRAASGGSSADVLAAQERLDQANAAKRVAAIEAERQARVNYGNAVLGSLREQAAENERLAAIERRRAIDEAAAARAAAANSRVRVSQQNAAVASAQSSARLQTFAGSLPRFDLTAQLARVNEQTLLAKQRFNDALTAARNFGRGGADGAYALSSQLKSIAFQAVAVTSLVKGIGAVLSTGIQQQRFQSKFTFATGDAAQAAKEMAFVREEADRLAIPLVRAQDSYSDLMAATKGTGAASEEVRNIWLGVAQAARVLNLPQERIDRAFLAITQTLSKGVVQAEEIRGQLSEQIPGSFVILADALGISQAELNERLKAGQVKSLEAMTAFAAELRRRSEAGLAPALDTLAAKTVLLDNAWFKFKQQIAESGALDAVQEQVVALTDKLAELSQSGDAQIFVRDIASAIGDLVKIMVTATKFVIDHRQQIAALAVIYAGFKVAKAAQGLAVFVSTAAAGVGAVTSLAGALRILLALVGGPIGIAAALLTAAAAWAIFRTSAAEAIDATRKKAGDLKLALNEAVDSFNSGDLTGDAAVQQFKHQVNTLNKALIEAKKQRAELSKQTNNVQDLDKADENIKRIESDLLRAGRAYGVATKEAAKFASQQNKPVNFFTAGNGKDKSSKDAEREAKAFADALRKLEEARIAAELQLLEGGLDVRRQLLDQRHKAELVSAADFIAAKAAIDEEGLRNELDDLQRQQAALRVASEDARLKPSEQTNAKAELATVEARIQLAQDKILNLNLAAQAEITALGAERLKKQLEFIEGLEQEAFLSDLSNDERERALLLMEAEKLGITDINRLLALRGQIEAANAAKVAAEARKQQEDQLYQSVQEGVQRAFADGLNAVATGEGGIRGALKNAVDMIRNALSNAIAGSLANAFLNSSLIGGKEGVLNIAGFFGLGGKNDGSSASAAIWVRDVNSQAGALTGGAGTNGIFGQFGNILNDLFGSLKAGFTSLISGIGSLFGNFGGQNIFGAMASLLGFAGGGWTGPGSKYQPAGIVHADEYVFSKSAVRRLGVSALDGLHRMASGASLPRSARWGYADGGMVNLPGAAAPVVNSNTRIVNLFDPSQVAGELGKTREFERAVLNVIQLNPRALQGGF